MLTATERPYTLSDMFIKKYFRPMENYFGIEKCLVLPAGDLKLLVSSFWSKRKLLLPLCGTYAEIRGNQRCKRVPAICAFAGSRCTPKVNKVIQLGYKVLGIYEVWRYSQTKKRLFDEYINKFLQLKTQASRWPADVETGDQKTQFLKDCFNTVGTLLDQSKIEVNPGLRALAKLALNR